MLTEEHVTSQYWPNSVRVASLFHEAMRIFRGLGLHRLVRWVYLMICVWLLMTTAQPNDRCYLHADLLVSCQQPDNTHVRGAGVLTSLGVGAISGQ